MTRAQGPLGLPLLPEDPERPRAADIRPFWSVAQTADWLAGLGESTVQRLVEGGRLEACHIPGLRRRVILAESIDRLADEIYVQARRARVVQAVDA